jgi:hypothetical protein
LSRFQPTWELENGQLESRNLYHQVYTDGNFVFDPRLSSKPVPIDDWQKPYFRAQSISDD